MRQHAAGCRGCVAFGLLVWIVSSIVLVGKLTRNTPPSLPSTQTTNKFPSPSSDPKIANESPLVTLIQKSREASNGVNRLKREAQEEKEEREEADQQRMTEWMAQNYRQDDPEEGIVVKHSALVDGEDVQNDQERTWTLHSNLPDRKFEVCNPKVMRCNDKIFKTKFKSNWVTNPRNINFEDPTICINKALSKGDSHSAPHSVHFRWRAPIFHHPEQLIDVFRTTAAHWESRWSIGSVNKHNGRFDIWERYNRTAEGRVSSLHPHYVEWAEGEPYLLAVRNAFVGVDGAAADCHRNFYHFNPGACFVTANYLNSTFWLMEKIARGDGLWDRFREADKDVYDKGFVIGQSYGSEFYHFLLEGATRLAYWRDFVLRRDVTIFVMSLSPWTLSFLRFFGIPENRVVPLEGRPFLLARTLYIPTPNPCLLSNAMHLRALRNFIHSKIPPVDDAEKTILFVSRRNSLHRGRNILNEEDLVATIRRRFPQERIEIFSDAHNLTMRAQFRVFNRAKIVIGPHGAGLANLVACRQDTKVLEFTNSFGRNFFLEMAAKLNLEYHLIRGTRVEKSQSMQSSITVDAAEIAELVGDMLIATGFEHLRTLSHKMNGKAIRLATSGTYPVCCKEGQWETR